MPEPRERLARGAAMRELSVGQGMTMGIYQERLRQAVAGELAAGRRIRRDFYHVELTPTRARMGRAPAPAVGKENVSPKSMLRQARPTKSPLSAWYPRTPLRDITALLDELERRRASLRSAARRRRSHSRNSELSPLAILITPSPQKPRATRADSAASAASDAQPPSIPLLACFPAVEGSPPAQSASAASKDLVLVQNKLEMQKSIDAIAELVRGGSVTRKQEARRKSALMSMR